MLWYLMPDEMARRIRIRSWKDLVLFIVMGVLYAGADYLLREFVPAIPDKVRSVVLTIVFVVLTVIGLFIIGE